MTAAADLVTHLEQTTFARDHDRSFLALHALLEHLDAHMNAPLDGLFDADDHAVAMATRVATAITTLLADPGAIVRPETFVHLIAAKRQMQAIFSVSGLQGTAHPLRCASDAASSAVRSPAQEQSQLFKMLLLMGLSDCSEGMLDVVGKLNPAVTAPFIVSLVASKVALTQSEWRAREALLGLGELLPDAPMVPHHLPLVTAAWMQCSYAHRADRHDFKAALNDWLRRSLEAGGVSSPKLRPRSGLEDRPRLVIIAEVLWDGHAMYRCYADRIQQLKERFETVLVGRAPDLDDAARALVDRVALFPDDLSQVDQMAEHVDRLQPDLVYYPSIGLQPWSVALANLRLAPIQLMSPGHPATSATKTIDYILLARSMVGDPDAYTERVVICGEGRPRHRSYADVEVPTYRRQADGAPVRIAVPAYSMKLSWPLIEAFRAIAKRARRPIQWCFFPNESGLIRQHVRVSLERLLEDVVVYPRAEYARYVEWLGRCQLAVGTFPFTGSNSNVDVLRAGLPKVVMRGRQGMERADVTALRRLDGLESLMTDDPEGFVAKTVSLIDDPEARDRLSARILEQNPTERFLRTPEVGQPFLRAFSHVYAHHDQLSDGDRAPIDPAAT